MLASLFCVFYLCPKHNRIIPMGFISSLFKKEAPQPLIIPSMEEQERIAKANLDPFLSQVLTRWNETEGEFKCDRFKIAGISYHCSLSDIGMIRGATFKDHNNPKDKSAIGIVALDNSIRQKMLGHIAKEDKHRFKQFSGDEDQVFFIGYIIGFETEDGQRGIRGMIKAYTGDTASKGAYQSMLKDTRLLLGVFRGYYEEENLAEEGLKPEWILNRHF